MGKFLVNIPDDSLDRLRCLSQQTGVPVSEYIRKGIDTILNPGSTQLVISGTLASGCVMLVMRG